MSSFANTKPGDSARSILLEPVSEGCFARALDFRRIQSLFDRMILRGIVAAGIWSQGDFRDWDAIRDWAVRTRPLLLREGNCRNRPEAPHRWIQGVEDSGIPPSTR